MINSILNQTPHVATIVQSQCVPHNTSEGNVNVLECADNRAVMASVRLIPPGFPCISPHLPFSIFPLFEDQL